MKNSYEIVEAVDAKFMRVHNLSRLFLQQN